MNITICYENHKTTLDVPEEDFALMIRLDYEKRLAEAKNPSIVTPRSPQEIMEERFNSPDYNNWRKFHRHWKADAAPIQVSNPSRCLSADPDESGQPHHFDMDEFPDLAGMEKQKQDERDRELREWIRNNLKPDYAEMLIAIRMEGMTVTDYAARINEKRTNVSHRLSWAEKKFKEIFEKSPI